MSLTVCVIRFIPGLKLEICPGISIQCGEIRLFYTSGHLRIVLQMCFLGENPGETHSGAVNQSIFRKSIFFKGLKCLKILFYFLETSQIERGTVRV